MIPSNYGRVPLHEYLDEADRSIFVCVMCETAEMIDNIEEIAAVPGLDSVCLGAMDLSGSLGESYEHNEKVDAAIDKVISTCHSHGVKVGFSTGSAEAAVKVAKKGLDWLNIGNDTAFMLSFWQAFHNDLRAKL